MPRIFISYRRADSQTITGRMYDRLVSEFGQHNVFKDVHDIHLGDDWREVLSQQVIESDVVLAVIGAKWLTITDAEGKRRLDNVDDYVRLEVVSGLKNKSGLVIPVLVDGMLLPKEEHLPDDLSDLVYRQFIQIREDPDFHNDMTRLIREIYRQTGETVPEQAVAAMPQKPKPTQSGVQVSGRFGSCSINLAMTVGMFIIVIAGAAVFLSGQSNNQSFDAANEPAAVALAPTEPFFPTVEFALEIVVEPTPAAPTASSDDISNLDEADAEADDGDDRAFECTVQALSGGQSAFLRSGPGADFPVEVTLRAPDAAQPVIAYTVDRDDSDLRWWLLESELWVREDQVQANGDCDLVPEVRR